ncbi:MAG: spermidine/putrescine ABC transporter substrate-binding protein, partial [Bdellovibrio sp.]|nr:spermidine/putrescine ABC transporter substrate-binding protein [Bdellovibrio sp.]
MQINFFLKVLLVVWFCTFFTLITSCTKKTESAVTNTSSRIVNLIIWSNYVSPELLARFEKQSKIKVQVSNYASNEELLAKLQAGATGYDVAVPSDYMVFAMSKLGLLHELEPGALSNFKNIDAKFLKKSFDPQNRVSVPYDWGTTGIAVNRKLYSGELKGWKNVFHNPKLKGKFTLLDDVRETIGASLKCLGKSLNTKNTEDLTKAKTMLLKIRDELKGFTSEPMMPLVQSETAVAHAYMSDALQARNKSKNP